MSDNSCKFLDRTSIQESREKPVSKIIGERDFLKLTNPTGKSSDQETVKEFARLDQLVD